MPHDIRQLSRRWFEQAWNQRDDGVLPELIAEDALIHGLAEDGRTLRGPGQFDQFAAHFSQPFRTCGSWWKTCWPTEKDR